MEGENIIDFKNKFEKARDEVDSNIFFDIKRTLTHNCLFNFTVGSRGCGKTFSFKKWAIEDFIKNEGQFIYVRRYAKEAKKAVKTFWDDVRYLFPEHELKVSGNDFLIDGNIAGHCIILSTAKIEKSVSYPFVNKICFDEFLIEKSNYRYLPDDVGAFLNLYETIARPGSGHCDVNVFFMANAITWTNPYFLYFKIKQPTKTDKNGKKIWKKGDILIELTDGNGFADVKRKTRFGQIVEGTAYGEYSIDNKFLLDDDTFIEKKSPTARYYFTFKYNAEYFGVWADFNLGKLWVSRDIDPSWKLVFAVTLKDHEPNTIYLKRISQSGHFKNFIEYYKQGKVGFENMNIKNIVYEVIRMTLTS